jgi:hypothetical protein
MIALPAVPRHADRLPSDAALHPREAHPALLSVRAPPVS